MTYQNKYRLMFAASVALVLFYLGYVVYNLYKITTTDALWPVIMLTLWTYLIWRHLHTTLQIRRSLQKENRLVKLESGITWNE